MKKYQLIIKIPPKIGGFITFNNQINSRKTIFIIVLFFLLLSVMATSYVKSSIESEDHLWNNRSSYNNNNKIDDDIMRLMKYTDLNQRIHLYIKYDHKPTYQDVDKLSKFDFNIDYVAKYTNQILVNDVCLKDIKKVADLDGVTMITPQIEMRLLLDVATPAVKARESSDYSPKTAWEVGFTGEGINIAIIDTGVDDEHESFSGKFVAGIEIRQPVELDHNPDDTDGHGTHCAGIALGTGGKSGTYKGAAPGSGLIDIKVSGSVGFNGGNVDKAIEWCIEHKDEYNIRIISISSYGAEDDDGDHPSCQTVNEAVDAGIVVVCGMGNEGPDNDGVPPPASADKAISVGSIDDQNTINRDDDLIVYSSSRGPRKDDKDDDPYDELKPDVVAPGENIISARAAVVEGELASDGYISKDGTSMATPMVAGIIALMLEANPDLIPQDVKHILHETAEARGEPSYPQLSEKYNVDYGYGIVDAYEAVKMAEVYVPTVINDSDPVEPTIDPVVVESPTSIQSNSISISWSQCTDNDFQKYELHKSTTADFTISSSTLVTTINERGLTNYKVTGLEEMTTYFFKVRVYNNDNEYSDSNEVKATTSSIIQNGEDPSSSENLLMPVAIITIISITVILLLILYVKMMRKKAR